MEERWRFPLGGSSGSCRELAEDLEIAEEVPQDHEDEDSGEAATAELFSSPTCSHASQKFTHVRDLSTDRATCGARIGEAPSRRRAECTRRIVTSETRRYGSATPDQSDARCLWLPNYSAISGAQHHAIPVRLRYSRPR